MQKMTTAELALYARKKIDEEGLQYKDLYKVALKDGVRGARGGIVPLSYWRTLYSRAKGFVANANARTERKYTELKLIQGGTPEKGVIQLIKSVLDMKADDAVKTELIRQIIKDRE